VGLGINHGEGARIIPIGCLFTKKQHDKLKWSTVIEYYWNGTVDSHWIIWWSKSKVEECYHSINSQHYWWMLWNQAREGERRSMEARLTPTWIYSSSNIPWLYSQSPYERTQLLNNILDMQSILFFLVAKEGGSVPPPFQHKWQTPQTHPMNSWTTFHLPRQMNEWINE